MPFCWRRLSSPVPKIIIKRLTIVKSAARPSIRYRCLSGDCLRPMRTVAARHLDNAGILCTKRIPTTCTKEKGGQMLPAAETERNIGSSTTRLICMRLCSLDCAIIAASIWETSAHVPKTEHVDPGKLSDDKNRTAALDFVGKLS